MAKGDKGKADGKDKGGKGKEQRSSKCGELAAAYETLKKVLGDSSPACMAAKQALEDARAARDQAKPGWCILQQKENSLAKRQKALAGAEAKLEAEQEEMAALAATSAETKAEIEKLKVEVASLQAEVAKARMSDKDNDLAGDPWGPLPAGLAEMAEVQEAKLQMLAARATIQKLKTKLEEEQKAKEEHDQATPAPEPAVAEQSGVQDADPAGMDVDGCTEAFEEFFAQLPQTGEQEQTDFKQKCKTAWDTAHTKRQRLG